MRRRTKLIATIGPASDGPDTLRELLQAGTNLVRINYSHGGHPEKTTLIQQTRKLSSDLGLTIGIIADLQGPKIRIGEFKNKVIQLNQGQTFILDCGSKTTGDEHSVSVDYQALYQDVYVNDTLLLDDGLIALTVTAIKQQQIHTQVITGGKLSSHKGINRQGGGLSVNALTDKDMHDLAHALDHGVDYIAVSFTRDPSDIFTVKAAINAKHLTTRVIAKIERKDALDNSEAIIQAADAIMVARGDLGVEIGIAEVPFWQRELIHLARHHNKAVITATQMMESMIHSPKPTRAEVSDIANAILEGSDAVMFSAETAVGNHPVQVIKEAHLIAKSAEKRRASQLSSHRLSETFQQTDEAIAFACMYTANHTDTAAIIALTESGQTPLWMSRIRSNIPIFGLSRKTDTLGSMTLFRGVFPVQFDPTEQQPLELEKNAIACLVALGEIQSGDKVIITRGNSVGTPGQTNTLKLLIA